MQILSDKKNVGSQVSQVPSFLVNFRIRTLTLRERDRVGGGGGGEGGRQVHYYDIKLWILFPL